MQSTAARLKERSQAGRSPAALQDATKVRSRCAAPRAASTRVKAARSPAVWWERTTAKSTIRTPMCASMHKAPWAASWEAVPASSSRAHSLGDVSGGGYVGGFAGSIRYVDTALSAGRVEADGSDGTGLCRRLCGISERHNRRCACLCHGQGGLWLLRRYVICGRQDRLYADRREPARSDGGHAAYNKGSGQGTAQGAL